MTIASLVVALLQLYEIELDAKVSATKINKFMSVC